MAQRVRVQQDTGTVVGENIQASLDGDTLTLTINLGKTGRPSSTGKTNLVATTGGFIPVGLGAKLNLTVTKPTR